MTVDSTNDARRESGCPFALAAPIVSGRRRRPTTYAELLTTADKQSWYQTGVERLTALYARLTSQHTEPENKGCRFTPPPVPLTGSLVRSDLAFAPSRSDRYVSGGVLAASVSIQRQVYAIQRYDGAEYDNRGVAA